MTSKKNYDFDSWGISGKLLIELVSIKKYGMSKCGKYFQLSKLFTCILSYLIFVLDIFYKYLGGFCYV